MAVPQANLQIYQGSLFTVTIPAPTGATSGWGVRMQLRSAPLDQGGVLSLTLTTGGGGIVWNGSNGWTATITPTQSNAMTLLAGVWDAYGDPDGVPDNATVILEFGTWSMRPFVTAESVVPQPPSVSAVAGDTLVFDGNQWQPQLSASQGPQTGVTPRFSSMDYNSIVTGDLSQPEWIINDANGPCQVSPASSSDGTFSDLVLLNANGAAPGTGHLIQPFSTPTGVTSVIVSITMAEASSKAVRLVVYQSDRLTIQGSLVCSCTTALTAFSFTAFSLTPGALYWVAIETNHAGQQAQPTCQHLTVLPISGSGVFASNFMRVRVGPELHAGSYGKSFNFGVSAWPYTNPQAEVSLITSAQQLSACLYNITSPGNCAWLVNGRPLVQSSAVGLTGCFGYANVSIPVANAGPLGAQLVTCRADQGIQNFGTYITAVLIPSPSIASIVNPYRKNRAALIYGDSIAGGNAATNILLQGWPSLFKMRFEGSVFMEQYFGRSFFTDTNNGATANELLFAKQVAKSNATDVILHIGVNDYANAQWTAANFGASYARVLDDIHAVLPNADVWCVSPIPKTVETANGLGDTLGAFRTQIQTAATAAGRAAWAHFIDGTGALFPTTSDLVDGVHPSTTGHAKIARAILSAMAL